MYKMYYDVTGAKDNLNLIIFFFFFNFPVEILQTKLTTLKTSTNRGTGETNYKIWHGEAKEIYVELDGL